MGLAVVSGGADWLVMWVVSGGGCGEVNAGGGGGGGNRKEVCRKETLTQPRQVTTFPAQTITSLSLLSGACMVGLFTSLTLSPFLSTWWI